MTILRREIYIIDNTYVKILDIENVNGSKKFRADWVGNVNISSATFGLNTDITIICENNKVVINEQEYTNNGAKSSEYLDYPIYINSFTDAGTMDSSVQHAYAKWKSFKIYDNDNLVRNYIPCKNSEGVPGMYDLVDKKFYSSNTEEQFIAGDEI